MEYPRCGVCGRPLKDEESVRKGIGPVCEAKKNKEVQDEEEGG